MNVSAQEMVAGSQTPEGEVLGQELPSISQRRSHKSSSQTKIYSIIGIVLLVVIGGPAFALKLSQDSQRNQLEGTFRARAPVTGSFVTAYIDQLEQHQLQEAEKYLDGPYFPVSGQTPVDQDIFQELVDVFGFQEAVLVTSQDSVVLDISQLNSKTAGIQETQQQNFAFLGEQIITGLPNLKPGQSVVSNLTNPTATQDPTPVVEISSAFNTLFGERILIGSYQIGQTPLSKFLNNAVEYSHHEVFLLDSNQFVLASSPAISGVSGGFQLLSAIDGGLKKAIGHASSGFYTTNKGVPSYFVTQSIAGTPWKLAIAVPNSQLFATISGHTVLVQWALFAVYALIVIFAAELFYRFLEGRNKLQALTQELDLVSRLDPLTGIYNRRHLDDHLSSTVSTVKRHNQSMSLLIADVDHFKRVNDTFGHDAGDTVLCEVTARMMKTLRSGDLLGRWGGEEFLVVLPMTSVEGAKLAAERMRQSICESPIALEDGQTLEITASFGCASVQGDDANPDDLIRRADTALYEAKETGRNKVVVAGGEGPSPSDINQDVLVQGNLAPSGPRIQDPALSQFSVEGSGPGSQAGEPSNANLPPHAGNGSSVPPPPPVASVPPPPPVYSQLPIQGIHTSVPSQPSVPGANSSTSHLPPIARTEHTPVAQPSVPPLGDPTPPHMVPHAQQPLLPPPPTSSIPETPTDEAVGSVIWQTEEHFNQSGGNPWDPPHVELVAQDWAPPHQDRDHRWEPPTNSYPLTEQANLSQQQSIGDASMTTNGTAVEPVTQSTMSETATSQYQEVISNEILSAPYPGWWLASDGYWYPPELHPANLVN